MAEYWMLPSTGNDGNGGTSETDAVKTFNVAKALLSAGDKLWVKAEIDITVQDGVNNCILFPTVAGTATAPIYIEAYHTAEGDNGVCVLDASVSGWANVINTNSQPYYMLKGFVMTGASAANIAGATSDDWVLVNCSVEDAGTIGVTIDDTWRIINCRVKDNTTIGIEGDASNLIVNSIFDGNFQNQVDLENGHIINCSAFNLAATYSNFAFSAPQTNLTSIINCSSEGGNAATTNGYSFTNASGGNVTLINSVASDLNQGIAFGTDTVALYEWQYSEYNAFYSNSDDVYRGQDVTDQDGSFVASSDPFADAANDDFRPAVGSELKQAGNDIGLQIAKWASYDDGDNPPDPDDEEYQSYIDIGCIQAKPILRRTVPRRN